MRLLSTSLAAALLVAGATAGEASAQGYWYGNTRVVPYVTPYPAPTFNYAQNYASPYGYQSFYRSGAYPTPYGFNTYQTYVARQQPIVSGPYHSVYFNPMTYTYQYGPGFRNAPTYNYRYRSGW